MSNKILNAKITSAYLGKSENGQFAAILQLEGCGWSGNCTLSYLDTWDMIDAEYKSYTPAGYKSIIKLMQSIGANSWEEMVGTYVRVEFDPETNKITKIGHILFNKWFDWSEFLESEFI